MSDIQFTVVGSEGAETFQEPSSDALNNITKIADEQDKWVYLDGSSKDPKDLTTEELESAQNITLSDMLVGG